MNYCKDNTCISYISDNKHHHHKNIKESMRIETMIMIGSMHAHTPGTPGGNGITSILSANGLNSNVNILTHMDLVWLLNQAINLGKTMGIREERARRKYGK